MSDSLNDALQAIGKGDVSAAYLLVGEEYLVRKGADGLIERLLPNASVGLNLITADGLSPKEIASELATPSLFAGRKVVVVRDPEWLMPKRGRTDALGKAKEAWAANRRKDAARRVLTLAAKAGIAPKNLATTDADVWEEELGIRLSAPDLQFLKDVSEYCAAEGLVVPLGDDAVLLELFTKGLSEGQILLIATTDLETKNPLVKWVKDHGVFIERKVAARLKDLDLSEFAAETLKPHGKKLGAGALDQLKDRVGGNFRLLASELNKLALYVDSAVISVRDVDELVGHAREEEYLELSEALQKRDYESAMKYLADALAQGAAPLQLLGAITGIVRTLLMNYERMAQLSDGKPPRSYQDFQKRVFPKVEAEAKAARLKVPHPYASFMGMQAAANYGREILLLGLRSCAESDLALKFGGDELVLQRLIWTLCGQAPVWQSQFSTIRREQER